MKEIAYSMTNLLKKSYVVICVVLTLLIIVSMYASLHPTFIIVEVLALFWTIAKLRAVIVLLADLNHLDLLMEQDRLAEEEAQRKSA